jgi:mRNA interferase MazF
VGRVRPDLVRGDVWEAEFDPIRGHEQAGRRPAVIVSADRLHQGWSGLAYVVPVTRTDRRSPWHIAVEPPEGGLTARSFIMCDQLRIFAVERLIRRRGNIDSETLLEVEDRLRVLLNL